jgi:hypothetical protein
MDLKEHEGAQIDLADDRDKWQAVMNMVMNFWFHKM